MGKLSKLFLQFDQFGQPIELNYAGKKQFRTLCGSLISLIIMVIFVMYSFRQAIIFLKKQEFNLASFDIVDLDGASKTINVADQRGGVVISVFAPGLYEEG